MVVGFYKGFFHSPYSILPIITLQCGMHGHCLNIQLCFNSKDNTFEFGHFMTITGHFFANYIKIGIRLLILRLFSSSYMLIKGVCLLTFYLLIFLNILFLSFSHVLENQIICSFKGKLCLFKGLCLFFCQMFHKLCLFKGVRLFWSLE